MTATARRLLQTTGEHVVVSLYFDLDPEEFATASARATQASSLLDDAHNLATADGTLNHDARQMLLADLERLRDHLGSDDLPVSGAGALAIFACGAADLFETEVLTDPVQSAVYVQRAPVIEPLLSQPAAGSWCAVLVSSRDAEIYRGRGRTLVDKEHSESYVRRGSETGGARHGESQDVAGHLIEVAGRLHEDLRAARFSTLLIGGPAEAADHLEPHLDAELRRVLAPGRLDVDPSAITDATLVDAVTERLSADADQARATALAAFGEALAAARGGDAVRAVRGVDEVLEAITERRVATLLLGRDFHAAGTRCPQCGLLGDATVSTCPVDGTPTAPVEDLREPLVAAAMLQDAEVIALRDLVDELPPELDVGATLRF